MLNIIDKVNNMLKADPSTYDEILYEFSADYTIGKANIPNIEELITFLKDIPEADVISLSFSDGTTSVMINTDAWIESFEAFVNGLYETDEVTVSIKIEKKVNNGVLNVYSLSCFSRFLDGRSYTQLFDIFTKLFKSCGNRIVFHLLDTNGSLRTENIAFSDKDVEWKVNIPRYEQLKNCEDACVFLDRTKYQLLPQDFTVTGLIDGSDLVNIKDLFERLRSIWSYLYLSNLTYIVGEKAMLQFDPVGTSEQYEFEELAKSTFATQIYDWVYKDDGCVDKAGIARRIINIYCRNKADILTIDEKLFNSIKSDYVIYQKNHVDQYIDMKNRISECIVASVKQMQELSHDVVEAFRNNFVAIIVFLMTVLLTDSIDFSQFLNKTVSSNVIAVCCVFTIGSLLYLIATIVMCNQKWKWLEQSYSDLKANYKGTLDDQDIEEAFNYDKPVKTVRGQFEQLRCVMISLWMALIICLMGFTGMLYMRGTSLNIQDINNISTEIETTSFLPSEEHYETELSSDDSIAEKSTG